MHYSWHWKVLLETEPGGTGSYLHYLIVGLGWTLVTALAAWVIALLVGAFIGTVRTTQMRWAVRLESTRRATRVPRLPTRRTTRCCSVG